MTTATTKQEQMEAAWAQREAQTQKQKEQDWSRKG